MTCIIAYKYNNKVYMAGDSAGVSGHDIRTRRDPKVFKNKDMVFGFTTSFRMGQILMNMKLPHVKKDNLAVNEGEEYWYMTGPFIDAVIEEFKKKGYAKEKESQVSGGTFLVGWRGEIYFVDSDFQVGMVNDEFDCCGCGENYALGAIEALDRYVGGTPEDRLHNAFEIVCKFSSGVRPPINIVSV